MTDQPGNPEYWADQFDRILKIEPIRELSRKTLPNKDAKHSAENYVARYHRRVLGDVLQFLRNAKSIHCDVDL